MKKYEDHPHVFRAWEGQMKVIRGYLYGLLFCIPLWLIIGLVVWWVRR